MPTHRCPDCGNIHAYHQPSPMCQCGHPAMSHNDHGGRNKKAYCTVWVHPDGDQRKPMRQCDCQDIRPAP